MSFIRDFQQWIVLLFQDHWISSCLSVVLLLIFFLNTRFRGKFPPGPRGLPVVGYLPFLSSEPFKDYDKLAKKYGGVFSLYLGSRYTVVLNSWESIREANNKDAFLGRPPGLFRLSDHTSHFAEASGKEWREQRRFTLVTLRTLGVGKNKTWDLLAEEVTLLQRKMETLCLDSLPSEETVDLRSLLRPYVSRTLFALVLGKRLEDGDPIANTWSAGQKATLEYLDENFIGFYLPFLKPLLRWWKPRLVKNLGKLKEMEEVMWKEIEKHEKNFEAQSLEDFVDHYIAEIRKQESRNTSINRSTMNGNCQLMLGAGTETILGSLEWVLLTLAEHPLVQERVHREVVEVCGLERHPRWEEKDDLPYTMSVLWEVYRCRTGAPLGDQRWTLEATKVQGLDIPKGTMVINNLWAVHNDECLWQDPQNFIPERFLSKDGRKYSVPEYHVAFSFGKRMCPGERFANMAVFSFASAIVQKFKILPPREGLSMEGRFVVSYVPKETKVRLEFRRLDGNQ